MKSLKLSPILALLAALAACQDMDVVNLNHPDAKRALSDPESVEALVGTAYYRWWQGTQFLSGGLSFSLPANEITSAWPNYGMLDTATQPRQP